LTQALGARSAGDVVYAPFAQHAEKLVLTTGDVLFAPSVTRSPMREVVGLTVLVHDLEAAGALRARNHVPALCVTGCGHISLSIGPHDAHGAWLELRLSRRGVPEPRS